MSALTLSTSCICQCSCGAKAVVHKAKQDQRLIQFLMGLNEMYTPVRGSILMMNPLPSIAQAFSILIQEEKQREVEPHTQLSLESASLTTHAIANAAFKTNYQNTRIGNAPYNSKQFGNHYSGRYI